MTLVPSSAALRALRQLPPGSDKRELFVGLFATEDQKAGMKSFLEQGPGKAQFTGR